MRNALQRGHNHEDRTTDQLNQLLACIKSACTCASNFDADALTGQKRADFKAAVNEIEAARIRIERLYRERLS